MYEITPAETPVTPGIRSLRSGGIPFRPYLFPWKEKGGTRYSAELLQISEHLVIKTLVFEPDRGDPFLVLMHGDREVSVKTLARLLGVKTVTPASEPTATRFTGYQFGGTSPFGTRRKMKVYAEKSIFDLTEIYINGGKRGFLVAVNPADLGQLLELETVTVATND